MIGKPFQNVDEKRARPACGVEHARSGDGGCVAIGESVGAMDLGAPGTPTLEQVERRDQSWAEALGAQTLAEQRALPAMTVLDNALKKGAPRFRPVIDGRLLAVARGTVINKTLHGVSALGGNEAGLLIFDKAYVKTTK